MFIYIRGGGGFWTVLSLGFKLYNCYFGAGGGKGYSDFGV
jgi:hypothetical protein